MNQSDGSYHCIIAAPHPTLPAPERIIACSRGCGAQLQVSSATAAAAQHWHDTMAAPPLHYHCPVTPPPSRVRRLRKRSTSRPRAPFYPWSVSMDAASKDSSCPCRNNMRTRAQPSQCRAGLDAANRSARGIVHILSCIKHVPSSIKHVSSCIKHVSSCCPGDPKGAG